MLSSHFESQTMNNETMNNEYRQSVGNMRRKAHYEKEGLPKYRKPFLFTIFLPYSFSIS